MSKTMMQCRLCGKQFPQTHGEVKNYGHCKSCRKVTRYDAKRRHSTSPSLLETMPEDVRDAAEWLKSLDPESLNSVWVASALHFAVEHGGYQACGPLATILNAVRDKFSDTGMLEAVKVHERRCIAEVAEASRKGKYESVGDDEHKRLDAAKREAVS